MSASWSPAIKLPVSRVQTYSLLDASISNGGRSKQTNSPFTPQFFTNNADPTFVTVYFCPRCKFKMSVNMDPCIVLESLTTCFAFQLECPAELRRDFTEFVFDSAGIELRCSVKFCGISFYTEFRPARAATNPRTPRSTIHGNDRTEFGI